MANSTQKINEVYSRGDYESDFEFEAEASCKRLKRNEDNILNKTPAPYVPKPKKSDFDEVCSKEQGLIRRQHLLALDAYSRHKEIINQYVLCFKGSTSYLTRNSNSDKTDSDILKENHHFIWDETDKASTWEKQLAKKYYERLFKEYCLADLSRYKENKIAMRWRTEQEVIDGKGQFVCGNIKCDGKKDIKCWEVNFGYLEHGQKKNALVKLKLCPGCSYKLNYHHKKKEIIKSSTATEKIPQAEKDKEIRFTIDDDVPSVDKESRLATDDDVPSKSSSSPGVWKKSIEEEVERKEDRHDEFEQYLADMFL